MPPDYSSMWRKLDRAEELLNQLNAKVDKWHGTKPYGFITKPNQDFTSFSVLVEIYDEPPIARWSLIYSDFLHNLRCALDHMVWAIAVHEDPPYVFSDDRSLMFPIWIKPPNSNDRSRIKRLSTHVQTAVEFMQPCNRPVTTGHPYHPLAILGDFDNQNKHKLLKLARPAIASFKMRVISNRQPGEGIPRQTTYRGTVEHGIEIIKVDFDSPHPEAKLQYGVEFIIGVRYEKANVLGTVVDDYAALGTSLIDEVVSVIGAVTAVVV